MAQKDKNDVLIVSTIPTTIKSFNKRNIGILQNLGCKVEIASNFTDNSLWNIEQKNDFIEEMKQINVECIQIDFARSPLKIIQHIKSYIEMLNLLKYKKYIFIHTNTPIASAVVRLAARKTKTKVFYTAHGFHFYKGAPLINWILYYPVEKLMSIYTDILITINKEDFDRAKKKFKAKEIYYVPGVGIDVNKFTDTKINREEKRHEIEVPEKAFVILSVGELNRNKNHQVVINALATLKNKSIHYVIAGIGEIKQELINLAEKLQVKNQIHFLGYRSDVNELCKMADVYILPSIREGLNVSLMEAMASGLPCIASNIRGNNEMIDENKGGYLVSYNKPEEFAESIIKIQEHLTEYGIYNSQKAKMFEIKEINKLMKQIYINSITHVY